MDTEAKKRILLVEDDLRLASLVSTYLSRQEYDVDVEHRGDDAVGRILAENPDLTLTINRSDLELTMMGAKELSAQIADGTAQIEGDPSVLEQLATTMVEFDPRFPIMPGTKLRETDMEKHNAYEAVPGNPIAE